MMRIIYLLFGCFLFASCSKNHDSNESANPPSVAITGATVMYASPGDIYAIDAASGAFRWQFSSNGALTRPAYGNGMIYIGTLDTLRVIALDDSTGNIEWSLPMQNEVDFTILINNTLYAGDNDEMLYAIDPLTGKIKWDFKANNSWVSFTSYGSMVLASNDDQNFYALDAESGNLRWTYSTSSSGVFASVGCLNSLIYECC